MEALDGLVECICRVIRKEPLEISKGDRALIKVLRLFHPVITFCISNKLIRSPVFPFCIYKICLSILCRNDIECLPLRISSVFSDPLPEAGGHPDDIFHQLHRLREDLPVHPLEYHTHITHIPDLECEQKRIIDMPAPKWPAVFQPSRIIKIGDRLPDLKFRYTFHFLSSFPTCFYLNLFCIIYL